MCGGGILRRSQLVIHTGSLCEEYTALHGRDGQGVLQTNLHLKTRFIQPISFIMDYFSEMHRVLKYQSRKSVKLLLKVTFI